MSLSLRPFAKRDIPGLKAWFHSEEEVLLWAGAGLQYPIRDSDLKALIKAHRGTAPVHEIWTIIGAGSAIIGHLQIWYSQRLRQATIGRLAIAPKFRGQALALPLVKRAIDIAFSRPEINRIELRVYDHNSAAIAAYNRAGFVLEGTRRQSTPIGDVFWNTNVMSILRDNYEGFDKRTEGE